MAIKAKDDQTRVRTLILVCCATLFLAMLLTSGSMLFLVPVTSGAKNLAVAAVLLLSFLPAGIAPILIKTLGSYAKQSEMMATRDPLTNLYNQATFWDFLGYEIERARRQNYRFTVMLVDLDNFKVINDTYGHESGDAYLIDFSKLFKASIRKGDIPARYAGDNFAAILPICDEAQAYPVAKRLLDNLRDHSFMLPDGSMARITASIGIAVFPDHAKDAESLFLLANSMINQAKVSGKDRVSMPGDEVDLTILKSAGEKSLFIMDSIRKNRIVPYFQPIVSVNRLSVLAYEVLTRIVTPERVVPASEFIEAAEGMGAIGKIDIMLVEKAFEIVKQTGYKGKLFLNLSPKVLVLKEFMPSVRQMMSGYGLEPSQLVFEITERETVKNMNLIEKSVADIKDQGFSLALDDFGSGYSSIQYLRMFKVEYLKIDGMFIRGMADRGSMEQSIVTNISRLANDLGIKTIAEYVESEQILGNVRLAGIDYAQGYYIRQPQPAM